MSKSVIICSRRHKCLMCSVLCKLED